MHIRTRIRIVIHNIIPKCDTYIKLKVVNLSVLYIANTPTTFNANLTAGKRALYFFLLGIILTAELFTTMQ
jgi:hypothetical protein